MTVSTLIYPLPPLCEMKNRKDSLKISNLKRAKQVYFARQKTNFLFLQVRFAKAFVQWTLKMKEQEKMKCSISELNRKISQNPRELVAECENRYQSYIVKAADQIIENMKNSPVVLLSGPSGSGKTTTAYKLEHELEKRGVVSHTISMDDYFHDVDIRRAPELPDGAIDFEHPNCVDMELLNEHFALLKAGKEIHVPKFLFARQKRSASIFRKLKLKENEIAIFEGIHALNGGHPQSRRCENIHQRHCDYIDDEGEKRFLNMSQADAQSRGTITSEEQTPSINRPWDNVLRGERLYIYPYMDRANIKINSALLYEVAVMKQFARPLFIDLPDDNPQNEELARILPALELFSDLSPDHVPEDSLLREFMGGSIYYNK